MKRFIATLKLDAMIQFRNRFYFIGLAVAIFFGVGLGQFFDRPTVERLLPLMYLFAVGGTTMLYVAGLVLFEKDQRTLDAVIVSPMRTTEYLLSKVITLTFLASLESLGLLLIAYGPGGFNPFALFGGIALLGAMLTLIGFIMVLRFDSITDFLIPALVVGGIMQMPFLHFIGLAEHLLWYLVPTTAPTLLMTAAWQPLELWQWVYAIGYSALILLVGYRWALSAFDKYIVLNQKGA